MLYRKRTRYPEHVTIEIHLSEEDFPEEVTFELRLEGWGSIDEDWREHSKLREHISKDKKWEGA